MINQTASEMVAKIFGCPKCGNRRMDSLEFLEDDVVECGACGTIYDPSKQVALPDYQEPLASGDGWVVANV